jgi:hypothetical protein
MKASVQGLRVLLVIPARVRMEEQVSPSQPRECSQFLLTNNTLHVQRHQPHLTIWNLQSYCYLVLRVTTD